MVCPIGIITISRNADDAPTNGAAKVFAFIRDRLLSGELKVGDRLLGERELALLLGVSRPILREALRALAVLGLLDIQHGRGAFVRRADMSALYDALTFCLAQQPNVLEDVMQARIAIECQAIRLACGRIGEDELRQLGTRLDAILASLGDPDAGGAADYDFHSGIVRASGSPTLMAIYESIAPLLHQSHVARRRSTAQDREITSRLGEAHREIFLCIARGDPDEAERCLREHFQIGDQLRRGHLINSYLQPGPPRNALAPKGDSECELSSDPTTRDSL